MTGRLPKVPHRPARPLTHDPGDILAVRPVLWRIHRVRGPHLLPWNEFRIFGPLPSARFDPHPRPVGVHPGCGITYAAVDVETTVAEVFQTARVVNTARGLRLTSWSPSRELRLLDLTGDWALRNGAAHALYAARRPTCRSWSSAIRDTWPTLDGLWAPSTLTGRPILALYQPAADSFPSQPAFSRALGDPIVWSIVADAARRVGYRIR